MFTDNEDYSSLMQGKTKTGEGGSYGLHEKKVEKKLTHKMILQNQNSIH